jgi:DNA-binding response OmpR family regulator
MSNDALQFSDLSKVFPAPETKAKPIPMSIPGGAMARILLGDTDPVFALTLFPSMIQAGYEVVVAELGADAIAELRKADHPPVALLDWGLPGMASGEICRRMRDAGKNVYLILIGDRPCTADIVAGLEAGADLFVPKSVPMEELLAYIKVGLKATSRQRVTQSSEV